MAPTFAMFVGSMMMPEPIMFTATMNVSCIRLIFLAACADVPFATPVSDAAATTAGRRKCRM